MGYDLQLGTDEVYISYNWSILDVRENIVDRTGKYTAMYCRAYLDLLKVQGIYPEQECTVDVWGMWEDGTVVEKGMRVKMKEQYDHSKWCDGRTHGAHHDGRVMEVDHLGSRVKASWCCLNGEYRRYSSWVPLSAIKMGEASGRPLKIRLARILKMLLEISIKNPDYVWIER